MSDVVLNVLVALAAVIHLLPVAGVLSIGRLERLYGITVDDPDIAVLLRHRAVLFGLLGVGLLAALGDEPELMGPVILATVVSDVTFAGLALNESSRSRAMTRVLWADLVSIACLVVAGALFLAG